MDKAKADAFEKLVRALSIIRSVATDGELSKKVRLAYIIASADGVLKEIDLIESLEAALSDEWKGEQEPGDTTGLYDG